MVFSIFHFVSIASHLTSGYHWEECSCITFTAPQKVIYTFQQDSSEPSFLQAEQSQISVSSQVKCAKPLTIILALYWPPYVYVCYSRDLRLDTQIQVQSQQCWAEVNNHLLQLTGSTLHNATQKTTGLPHHKGIILTHGQQVIPKFFSEKLPSSWSPPPVTRVWGFPFPGARLWISLLDFCLPISLSCQNSFEQQPTICYISHSSKFSITWKLPEHAFCYRGH